MTTTRLFRLALPLFATTLALAGCRESEDGPIKVVAIGPAPTLANPDRGPIGPAGGMLLDAVAQGLVRFDAGGEVEPALAQSWIVSDDGRRYTFRLRRAEWARGERVTAQQVVQKLQAAMSRGSRNALKPVLGAIDQIEAMTNQVLEIRLKSPRPNFLHLLAQPEMAILINNEGTGPYQMGGLADGVVRLIVPPADEDEEVAVDNPPEVLLRGDPAAAAIARFAGGEADLVTGGTTGELPLLRAARLPGDRIAFDPARGLLGFIFLRREGLLSEAPFRQALSMAIDRQSMIAALGVPGLQPRASLLPAAIGELPGTAGPDWAATPLPTRREVAARIVADLNEDARPRLRVALPSGPGYRILFAHLRRDWRYIGVDAVAVRDGQPADLRLIDAVAPADLAPWYLRQFLCAASPICDRTADLFIEAARTAPTPADRQSLLLQADRILNGISAYIPISAPVRWSLRSERLNGFRTNPFARHSFTELLEPED